MLMLNQYIGFGAVGSIGGNDAFTKLLLHCDGADASTTFTDSSSGAKTVTPGGNAQIDTAQSQFGGASALFDGTSDQLTLANSADWDFGTGEFTVDFWVRRNGSQASFAGLIVAESGTTGWQIEFSHSSDPNKVVVVNDSSVKLTSSTTIADATWTHVAVVRSGDTLTLFFGGSSVASASVAGETWSSSGSGLGIGTNNTGAGGTFNGHLDEIRVSKGVARWTANFTPPTEPYS
jgi:hypothetical protein